MKYDLDVMSWKRSENRTTHSAPGLNVLNELEVLQTTIRRETFSIHFISYSVIRKQQQNGTKLVGGESQREQYNTCERLIFAHTPSSNLAVIFYQTLLDYQKLTQIQVSTLWLHKFNIWRTKILNRILTIFHVSTTPLVVLSSSLFITEESIFMTFVKRQQA